MILLAAACHCTVDNQSEISKSSNASVKSGVIKTWDASAWSNSTGAGRIDWERSALTKNVMNISENLTDDDLFIPSVGLINEWLPCCYSGSQPPNQTAMLAWPVQPAIGQLKADNLLIALNCTNITLNENCTGNSRILIS